MALRHELEELVAQRAFPQAQALLAGVPLRSLGQFDIGWHDTKTHPLTGSFAVIADGAGLADLRGEILRVSSGAREVFVWVVALRAVPVPISLSRRAFFALGLLACESLPCIVEVVS